MLAAIKSILIAIVGFFLAIPFVIIPTLTFKPEKTLSFLEKEISIQLPKQGYKIENVWADNFAFESHYEYTLVFDEKGFKKITDQIESFDSSLWKEVDDGYQFDFTNDVAKARYIVHAKINRKDRSLFFRYSDM